MKKLLSIILTLALLVTLCAALGGCEKEKKPLRVLIDINPYYGLPGTEESVPQSLVDTFYDNMKLFLDDVPEDIEFEIVPTDEDERKIFITRIRTEIMAGGGPDLFIAESTQENPLFLMPEKSMELGLFYPLDKFIKKAQFMEWDDLNQTVMAAGYSEEYGQVLLPLAYTFPVTYFQKADLPEAPEGNTWQDVLNDETEILQAASALRDYGGSYDATIEYTYTELADYKNRKLLFTEDELLTRLQEYFTLVEKHSNGDFEALPDFYKSDICVWSEYYNWVAGLNAIDLTKFSDHIPGWPEPALTPVTTEPLTLVPAYNAAGGITAEVTVFGAINANSKRAEDAFYILDYLLSEVGQSQTGIMRRATEGAAIPVHNGVMTKETPVACNSGNWYLTDENYAEFAKLRDQITCVRITGTLERELHNLTGNCISPLLYDNGGMERVEELVHQYYTRMKQEVSE